MAGKKRSPTNYGGVFYRESKRLGGPGTEKVFYIVFKKDGKIFEEKVGRQYADGMTPAKASGIRAERIEGRRISRKEAREVAAAKLKADAARPSIARLWAAYTENWEDSKGTATDKGRYALHLEKKFSSKTPSDISTLEVDKLRNDLLRSGKSPQTVLHVLGLLRRIIRFGVKKGLCPMPDPSKLHFEMPRVDNKKTESLTESQLVALKAALDAEPDQNAAAFIRLALATGMRKGALLGLQWADIDFDRGTIRLRGEVAKKGKTEYIPLTAASRNILKNVEQGDSPFVFPGRDGKKREDFRRVARRVKKKAGLPEDFRPLHGLRHAYASFLASSGKVDLYTLQKLLTHSSSQMTQRYAHLADEAMHRAASVIDEIIL